MKCQTGTLVCGISQVIGVWRSLVARSAGGREVAGSNPVTPILSLQRMQRYFFALFQSKKLYKKALKIRNLDLQGFFLLFISG